VRSRGGLGQGTFWSASLGLALTPADFAADVERDEVPPIVSVRLTGGEGGNLVRPPFPSPSRLSQSQDREQALGRVVPVTGLRLRLTVSGLYSPRWRLRLVTTGGTFWLQANGTWTTNALLQTGPSSVLADPLPGAGDLTAFAAGNSSFSGNSARFHVYRVHFEDAQGREAHDYTVWVTDTVAAGGFPRRAGASLTMTRPPKIETFDGTAWAERGWESALYAAPALDQNDSASTVLAPRAFARLADYGAYDALRQRDAPLPALDGRAFGVIPPAARLTYPAPEGGSGGSAVVEHALGAGYEIDLDASDARGAWPAVTGKPPTAAAAGDPEPDPTVPTSVDFFWSVPDRTLPRQVHFFGEATPQLGRTISSWSWDFGPGGGGTSAQTDPVHTFPAPGVYAVTLTVTDSGGAVAQASWDVTVAAYGGPEPPM
jgi:hypothetical protein